MAKESKTFILFTYGTLMQGELNEYLLNGARFIGKATTKPCYDLLSIPGNYPFPALMETGKLAVKGELYEVPIVARNVMDQIEGHPFNYCRKPVELDGTDVKAIAYFLVNADWTEHAEPIKSGDWRKR